VVHQDGVVAVEEGVLVVVDVLDLLSGVDHLLEIVMIGAHHLVTVADDHLLDRHLDRLHVQDQGRQLENAKEVYLIQEVLNVKNARHLQ